MNNAPVLHSYEAHVPPSSKRADPPQPHSPAPTSTSFAGYTEPTAALFAFTPLSSCSTSVFRALSDSAQSELRSVGPALFPGDAALRDVARLVPRGMFDKGAVDAWLAIKGKSCDADIDGLRAVVEGLPGTYRSDPMLMGSVADGSRIWTSEEEAIIRHLHDAIDKSITLIKQMGNVPNDILQLGSDGKYTVSPSFRTAFLDTLVDPIPVTGSGSMLNFIVKMKSLGVMLDLRDGEIQLQYNKYPGVNDFVGKMNWYPVTLAQLDEYSSHALADLNELKGMLPSLPTLPPLPAPSDRPLSSWEIHEELSQAISEMNENYLGKYQDIVAKYTEYFDDINTAMSKFSEYISTNTTKEGYVYLELGMRDAIKDLLSTYKGGSGILMRAESSADAKAWAEILGPLAVADGNTVRINTTELQALYDQLQKQDGYVMSPQQFQALKEGLDIHMSKLQTNMQTLIQKYSTANSTFDNLIKVLSSTISSLMETDKGFLNI